MSDAGVWPPPPTRARVGWWLFVGLLAVLAAFIAYSFAGILVLGLFGYYATRPINRRIASVVDSDDVAAWLTVLLVVLPLILVLFYVVVLVVQQAMGILGDGSLPYQGLLEALPEEQRSALLSAVENPRQLLSDPRELLRTALPVLTTIASVQLLIGLAVTLTAFLHAHDDDIAAGFRRVFGDRDSTAYAYAAAVDEDFESVFFGNFLFVLLMAVVATVVYWGTNVVAPPGLNIPIVIVLGVLTGIASLIPVIVGKVVYIPVVAHLALQAAGTDGTPYLFVGAVFVVYFFVLDFLPLTFIQPYVSGRQLHTVMMMFGYILGPALFGWYGLFLLPMVFIVMLQAIRIVLPNLVRGEALTPAVEMGHSTGTTPQSARDDVPEVDSASDAEPTDDATDEPS